MPKVKVEVAVDATKAQQGFKQTSKAANQFSKDLSKSVRGAAAGTGVFRGLGRSIAFASGGFLAFASAGEAIRKSIDAATQAAATQRQLAAQFKAAGIRLKDYRGRIEEASLAVSKLSGFTRDDLEQSFITAFRGSKNVTKSLLEQRIAADVARGAHRSLSAVTLALSKAYQGQGSQLRRLGVLIPKHLSGMKALLFVEKRFAGQAAAGSTAQERFGSAIQNTEETIGRALLPTLTKYLNKATVWLDQDKNQAKIQRSVNEVVGTASGLFHGLASAVEHVRGPVQAVNKALGGTKNTVELLIAAMAANKISKFALLGSEAATAAARVAKLRLALMSLARIGIITIAIELLFNRKQVAKTVGDKVAGFLGGTPVSNAAGDSFFPGGTGKPASNTARSTANAERRYRMLRGQGRSDAQARAALRQSGYSPGEVQIAAGYYRTRGHVGGGGGQPRAMGAPPRSTALGFNARFANQELRLAQAGLTKSQADDRQVLMVEAAMIRERLKRIAGQRKHLKEQTQLTQQLVQIEGELAGTEKKAKDKRKKALEKQIAADKQRAQALKQQIATLKSSIAQGIQNIRSQVGELFQGPVLNPSDQQIKARLGVPGPKVRTLTADLKAQTAQYARFNRDLAKLGKRGAPKELLKELRGMGVEALPQIEALTHASRGQLRAYFKAFGRRESLVQKVGRVQMHADIVRLHADRMALARVREDIKVKVYLDGKDVTDKVTVQQQKRRKRGAPQRRGRHPGDVNATN